MRLRKARKLGAQRRPIRILIVDEHPVVRAGLRVLLRAPGFQVVGDVATPAEALRLIRSQAPDVTLFEFERRRNHGLDFVRRIKEKWPKISVVALTSTEGPLYVSRAIAMGCSGYFVKSVGRDELLRGIRAILRGECIVEPAVLRDLLAGLRRRRAETRGEPGEPLTIPEREVLRLIAEGQTNSRIAQRLGYSVGTVKGYIQNIILKLEVSDRTQAAVKAVRRGLLD